MIGSAADSGELRRRQGRGGLCWRLAGLLGPMLGALAMVGCFTTDPIASLPGSAHPPLFHGPSGPDVVQLYVAMVEQSVGDSYISRDLWKLVDEQSIDPLHKVLLEENGLRFGLIGGTPPAPLQRLITSDRCGTTPRNIQMHADRPTSIPLGGLQAKCQFQLINGSQVIPVELDDAECQLEVTPTLRGKGRIDLRIVPVVKHGKANLTPQPIRDPSGTLRWEMQMRQPTETYGWLGWEATVSSSEYIVIGVQLEKRDTLGRACFLDVPDGSHATPAQRLLVLRAARAEGDPHLVQRLMERAPPIALQAALSGGR